ncbi:hypothetical protein [Paracoccus sp. NSM]|uniref:hypothetical protein n=1 Tax=Paracoccus sp. NSM TaxID=3457784 RepID=UPI004035AE40
MKHFMLTAAAIALTTPAWSQQPTTTEAPADTMQTAPVQDGATTETGTATGTMGGTAQDGTMGGTAQDGTMQDGATGMTTETTPGMAQDDAVMTQPGMDQSDTDVTMTRRSSAELGATLSPENQGITASWLTDRSVYTTNEPSSSQWNDVTGGTRPDDWNDIGAISDLVLTAEGELIGYVADIGGFLGLGTHTVLLNGDMLHVARFDDEIVMATNFTQEELEAMPEFDPNNVMAD